MGARDGAGSGGRGRHHLPPLDQAGDVGDHEAAVLVGTDHAEIRLKGGETDNPRPLGRAEETARMKVDLPAFGMPSRPTSASTLSSR